MGKREERKAKWSCQGSSKKLWLILLLMVLAAGALAIPLFVHLEGNPLGGGEADDLQGQESEPIPPVQLSITCVGDIMAHTTQLTAQYDSATDTYDFSNNYIYVKDYISKADLALCNVETTFRGGTPTGYPAFNSPDSLASAIADAGFDVAITANNHMMDTGFDGMQRTLEVLRNAGLVTTGSRYEGEKNYNIVDVKGVKTAVVAYTYETPMVNGRRTINGNGLSDQAKALINSFSYSSLDQDLEVLKQSIEDARADGAQLVIAYLHWGEEYQRSPNDWQQTIAAKVAGFGADVIFASHPHVLQPMEYIYVEEDGHKDENESGDASTADGDVAVGDGADGDDVPGDGGTQVKTRKVPVFYSMGNFISNQRQETLDNRYTEQGMLANVELTWDVENQEILEISMNAMPVWVDRYKTGGKQAYYLIPLDNAMNSNETLNTSGHLKRAKQALEDVRQLLGDEFLSDSCPPAATGS